MDSPLINAAQHDFPEALKALLKARADVCHRNSTEKTAQDVARASNCNGALRVLNKIHDLLEKCTMAGISESEDEGPEKTDVSHPLQGQASAGYEDAAALA